jgi:oligoendopeptidase F
MDWSGADGFRDVSWQVQGHLYGAPFYYIEYGIAQLGSLQLWQTHRRDSDKALEDYANAMTLGNTKSLPDLFSAADLNLGFSESHLSPLIDEIGIAMQELA